MSCSDREENKKTNCPAPDLDPKLKRILDRILEENQAVFEALARK